ncbi:Tll0287-like domain-containing protein [Lacimicrobium alkaliphilum]|uniref:Tll0287-like domain-containing protein n=1 Tax=Lacimicrobium alkaliphilum TaxID=1526571 RepID=A0A0U2ZJI2_9ALTE|nr:DUF3365 domain-containing protein [Lacimicrobium alkaliphilum]ALS98492.1 hypothetical protein AT746_09615 [Lacimicrobium alkaliphilum]
MNTLIKLSLLPLLLPAVAAAQDNSELEKQAKEKIKAFATNLKSELSKAIQQGGLEQGIRVCHHRAPEIAAQSSNEGWQLGRTSLKLRNPDNAPDSWEQNILQQFQGRFEDGESLQNMAVSAKLDGQQTKIYRYMQAIAVDSVCLACHGQDIAPATRAMLEKYYPEDQATGFQAGDLRGAFSLTKYLEQANQ